MYKGELELSSVSKKLKLDVKDGNNKCYKIISHKFSYIDEQYVITVNFESKNKVNKCGLYTTEVMIHKDVKASNGNFVLIDASNGNRNEGGNSTKGQIKHPTIPFLEVPK